MNSMQQPVTSVEAVSKGQLWTGRVLSGIAVLFLTMDTAFKLVAVEHGGRGDRSSSGIPCTWCRSSAGSKPSCSCST